MSYKITPYTLAQAKKLGVSVKPSTVAGKKLDVFKNVKGEVVKVATIIHSMRVKSDSVKWRTFRSAAKCSPLYWGRYD